VKSYLKESKTKSSTLSNDIIPLNFLIGSPPIADVAYFSIDSQIVFNKLSRITLRSIVDLRLLEVQSRLDDRQITLNVDDAEKSWLAEHGYSPIYGTSLTMAR
jgi:hypothetical protein